MLLVLDVGNTQIFGGVFDKERIQLRFRRTSQGAASSDEYGLFLKSTLRENGIAPEAITQVIMASVVPDLNHTLASSCIKYFNLRPLILGPGVRTGLKILVHHPNELGADRVANAVGGLMLFPNENLVIFDFGTANTACVITKNKEYVGGLIAPGLRLSMEALEQHTARLPTVEIAVPEVIVAKNTVAQIQAGLYYSALGLAKEFIHAVKTTLFPEEAFRVLGTGGFARLYQEAGIFDRFEPDLVLFGLYHIQQLNTNAGNV